MGRLFPEVEETWCCRARLLGGASLCYCIALMYVYLRIFYKYLKRNVYTSVNTGENSYNWTWLGVVRLGGCDYCHSLHVCVCAMRKLHLRHIFQHPDVAAWDVVVMYLYNSMQWLWCVRVCQYICVYICVCACVCHSLTHTRTQTCITNDSIYFCVRPSVYVHPKQTLWFISGHPFSQLIKNINILIWIFSVSETPVRKYPCISTGIL